MYKLIVSNLNIYTKGSKNKNKVKIIIPRHRLITLLEIGIDIAPAILF
jgi:hypothetical protein